VSLRRSPRYIDLDRCTACGDCVQVCPVVRPNEFDMALGSRKAIYKPYAQAIPSGFTIEKYDRAPCRAACPANLNVQGYVQMVKEGKYREAVEIIMQDLPFPGVLGRVCPHPCEKSCRRLEVDEAISIRELKRVAADHVKLSEIPIPQRPSRQEKVAVIGSGPAGLSAAYFLARDGYRVSVYEAMEKAGGMMRYGIPEHRLPRSVLDAEIENLKRYGIEIFTNTAIGKDLTIEELQEHGADAIFLAVGAWQGLKLGIAGEEGVSGVEDVTTFLRKAHLGKLKKLKGKVIVIGGGHSALDGARVALRLGADEVHILYRRSRKEMLAEPEEVEEAEREGVRIHFQAAPLRISSENGKVSGMECIRTRLTEPDTTGRRKPIPIEGSEFYIEADHIVPAIGQEPDLAFLGEDHDLELSRWGFLVVNSETLQTNKPGIFAGGDVITGPATVIEAVEAGRRAARYIAKYLQGEDLPTEWQEEPPMGTHWAEIAEGEPKKPRLEPPILPVERRLKGFEEVNLLANEDAAKGEASRCLNCGGCCECYQCVTACKAGALTLETHTQQEEVVSLSVGSVILAPGFQPFDAGRFAPYGYGVYPNVVTSMEFERILSATGPYQGHLIRPSDRKEPRNIAWLQCIGSRDINQCDHPYCSSVCCMYAIKEAVIAKEHAGGELNGAIFFMDMRTYGKDFEQYYNRAKEEQGIRFIRSRVHSVEEDAKTHDLLLTYVDETGELLEERFDLVVLSVGLETSGELVDLAERLRIDLDEDAFARTTAFHPVETSREGIYVCGAFQEPKDIPYSVMQASAAACEAKAILASARGTLVRKKGYPQEEDVSSQEPRIGVFVCHCGTNIGGILDVPAVAQYARTLPGVTYVEENLFTCSQDTQDKMKEVISREHLNRVIVAACTPTTHEPLFQETLRDAGLNKYLFEMANIRNQCSWVHSREKRKATEKAKDLVRMAVARAQLINPLPALTIEVNDKALVLGGGISGMAAALGLADQGFHTYLVEQSDQLGGNALNLLETWRGEDVAYHLEEMIERVEAHPAIEVFTRSRVKGAGGFVGNFETTVSRNGSDETLKHGALIVAVGAEEHKPREYLYGEDDRVMTHLELDRAIRSRDRRLEGRKAAVFVQCVGSREPERPYCSKVCCTHTMKSALKLKEMNPDREIYVLYRDIRTYGQRESLYTEARRKGVVFIRYRLQEKPRVVRGDDALSVKVKDHVLGRLIEIEADLLVLASAIVPRSDSTLARLYKLPLNKEGFFMEAHAKLRPVDFTTDGIFLAGMAHYPKPIEESIAQAKAAAARAASLLSREHVEVDPIVSVVDQDLCIGCGLCEMSCPYGAIRLRKVEGAGYRAENLSALCKGCGICAAACPQKAIDMEHFQDRQIEAEIEAGGRRG